MNVWLKSLKSNKLKSRFSSSTVSGLNRSELQTIPQTEQNSSQQNKTLKDFQQNQKSENVFKGNINTLISKQMMVFKAKVPKTDHFRKKQNDQLEKGNLPINRVQNYPSSYNSQIMRFQNNDQEYYQYQRLNSKKKKYFQTSNNGNHLNLSQKTFQSLQKNKFSENHHQSYTTSSTSNVIAKIESKNSILNVKPCFKTSQNYSQSQTDQNSDFVNKFKSKISSLSSGSQSSKIKQEKNGNEFQKKRQQLKSKQIKFYTSQINKNSINSSNATQEDKNNVVDKKSKRIQFLSSFNQYSSSSRENQAKNQFFNSAMSKQSSFSSIKSEKSVKQNHINSKSIKPTTGKNLQHLKQYVVCVMEYCSRQIGLACYNNSTGEMILSQIIENMTYYKTIATIQRYYPIEIIYSQTMEKSLLIKKLMQKFKKTTFRYVHRKNFDQTRGFYLYNEKSKNSEYNPNNKFIAFACFNALILYLQNFLQSKLKYQNLQIKWHRLQQVLTIQSQTITDLQIFTNFQTKKVHNSFIQNFKCKTYGGTRMLRANILQPSTSLKVIFERQQLLEKLLQNQNVLTMLQKDIVKFRLYEPVTSKFIQNPKQQNLKSLKVFLSSILLLSYQSIQLKSLQNKLDSLKAVDFPIICDLKKKLQSKKLQELRDIIEQNFNQEILKNYQQMKNKNDKFIFLFKVEKIQDEFAQITRITYSQTINSILQIFQTIKDKSKSDLKLLYNDARGYYISAKIDIDLRNLSQKLKENIVHISRRGRSITFSTSILASLNNRLKESQRVLILQSQSLLRKVISEIQQNIDILFQINHFLSTVDMIMSFAGFVLKNIQVKFVKPTFSKGSNILKIKNLNQIWFQQVASSQNNLNPLKLISFQNLGDKSIFCYQKEQNSFQQQTFIFSIGYTIILSQIGCFVPAQNVNLDLFDSLISKIHLHESIQMNMSRFQLTIAHFNNIVQNCTIKAERCLLLIDELVKGTQHTQECALSLAIVQQLRKNSGVTFILCSDRMLLSMLSKFKKVQVQLSKKGINSRQRYEEMNKWIINACQQFNFHNSFVNSIIELDIEDDSTKNEEPSQQAKLINEQQGIKKTNCQKRQKSISFKYQQIQDSQTQEEENSFNDFKQKNA